MYSGSIIVVGGSAGALPVLRDVIGELPENFPSAIFVVIHISPDAPSYLADILSRAGRLPAAFAKDGEKVVPSRIYIAPPDQHLIIADGSVRLTRDPRENRTRPAIDPLFRSAARAFGHRVIALLLSGLYDDGVQGLQVVGRNGGKVIVLKPEEAPFPQMPENAIRFDHPDFILSARDISTKLQELVANVQGGSEMRTSDRVSDREETASGYVCPDCGGSLFENGHKDVPHFRCRIGHSYSLEALLSGENDALETALWAAVRSLQENADLKERTAALLERNGPNPNAVRIREDAKAQMQQSALLREKIIEVQRRSGSFSDLKPSGN